MIKGILVATAINVAFWAGAALVYIGFCADEENGHKYVEIGAKNLSELFE